MSGSNWVENLYQVLWAHRTTAHSSTGETPFKLVYGTETVIPLEIGNPTWRISYPIPDNNQRLRDELDVVNEVRELAKIKDISRKQQVPQRYNLKVHKKSFQVGDLVLRRASIGNKNAKEGTLANWEGPYLIRTAMDAGAYSLESLTGKEISRTFNAVDLRRYYS
jgi:hypothetical protein